MLRYRGAHGLPPGRHDRQAAHDEQRRRASLPPTHAPPALIRRRRLEDERLTVVRFLVQISRANVKEIIFRKHASAPVGQKFLSLFPGLGYAAGYKVAQRVYKFGGQPWFRDLIQKHDGGFFTRTFGEKKGKMIREATAGSYVLASRHVGSGQTVNADKPCPCCCP